MTHPSDSPVPSDEHHPASTGTYGVEKRVPQPYSELSSPTALPALLHSPAEQGEVRLAALRAILREDAGDNSFKIEIPKLLREPPEGAYARMLVEELPLKAVHEQLVAIKEIARSEESAETRALAIRTLKRTLQNGDSSVIPLAAQILKEDLSPLVKGTAIDVLQGCPHIEAQEALLTVSRDPDIPPLLRIAAVRGLSSAFLHEHLDELISLCENEKNSAVQSAVSRRLTECPLSAVGRLLEKLLEQSAEGERAPKLKAIAQWCNIAGASGGELIMRLLSKNQLEAGDPRNNYLMESMIRQWATHTQGCHELKQTIATKLLELSDTRTNLFLAAHISPPAVVETLRQYFRHPRTDQAVSIRKNDVFSIIGSMSPEALPPLLPLIREALSEELADSAGAPNQFETRDSVVGAVGRALAIDEPEIKNEMLLALTALATKYAREKSGEMARECLKLIDQARWRFSSEQMLDLQLGWIRNPSPILRGAAITSLLKSQELRDQQMGVLLGLHDEEPWVVYLTLNTIKRTTVAEAIDKNALKARNPLFKMEVAAGRLVELAFAAPNILDEEPGADSLAAELYIDWIDKSPKTRLEKIFCSEEQTIGHRLRALTILTHRVDFELSPRVAKEIEKILDRYISKVREQDKPSADDIKLVCGVIDEISHSLLEHDELKIPKFFISLLDVVVHSPHKKVRSKAEKCLSDALPLMRHPSVIKSYTTLLMNDDLSEDQKAALLRAVPVSRLDRAGQLLARTKDLLVTAKSAPLREAAFWALAGDDDIDTFKGVLENLSSKSSDIRATVYSVLANLYGDLDEQGVLDPREVFEVAVPYLTTVPKEEQQHFAKILNDLYELDLKEHRKNLKEERDFAAEQQRNRRAELALAKTAERVNRKRLM